MADASYVKSLCGSLGADVKLALGRVFEYVLGNIRFGPVAHQTRATNFQAFYLEGTTPTTANVEFSVAHGLGRIPYTAFPVLRLDSTGGQIVPLRVTRTPDASQVYLASSSTNVSFAVMVE